MTEKDRCILRYAQECIERIFLSADEEEKALTTAIHNLEQADDRAFYVVYEQLRARLRQIQQRGAPKKWSAVLKLNVTCVAIEEYRTLYKTWDCPFSIPHVGETVIIPTLRDDPFHVIGVSYYADTLHAFIDLGTMIYDRIEAEVFAIDMAAAKEDKWVILSTDDQHLATIGVLS